MPYLKMESRFDRKWAHPQACGDIDWVTPHLVDYFFEQATRSPEEIAAERTQMRQTMRDMYLNEESAEVKADGDWQFITAPGCVEAPGDAVDATIRTPKNVKDGELLPCIFEIMGGGLYAGACPEQWMAPIAELSKLHHAVVVCPAHRLCLEAPYPASVNDCHAAYQYILDHARELHVDTNRIVIHGSSAGGHMALCLTFRLKRYGIKPRGVVVTVPTVDDCNDTKSGAFSFRNPEYGSLEAWDGEGISATMQLWLKGQVGNPLLPPEAVPNRATVADCIGFPPLWMPYIMEMDPSRDSTLEFLHKMHEANVFVDYHLWGGCNHGVGGANAPLSKLMVRDDHFAIDQAIEFDFSRPWTEEG